MSLFLESVWDFRMSFVPEIHRVVGRSQQEGLSRRQAAARFGVADQHGDRLGNRYPETGSVAPGKMGGHRKLFGRTGTLVERCQQPDFTLRRLMAELAERGVKVDYRAVWQFVTRGLRYKKNAVRP